MVDGMPQDPVKPKPIEMVLMEQANDAVKQGADPHAATEMLGTMIKHLRANPDVAAHANDAIAQGADPAAVSARIHQLTQSNAAPMPHATPGQQFGSLVASGATLSFAPKILGAIDAAGKILPKALGGESAPLSSFGPNYTATRDRIRAAADEGIQNHPVAGRVAELAGGALTALPLAAERATATGAQMLEQGLTRAFAKNAATGAGIGAVAAAGNATGGVKDYVKSMAIGAGTGAIVGAAAPPLLQAAGSATSKLVTALGLRPTGRTAEEMAADAATMQAPVGAQANSATPVTAASAGNTTQLGPTFGQRAGASVGSGLENLGVESSKTRALREIARRFEFDNVTRPDATAFIGQNAGKPVAPLDLGGGNVAGLVRTAKDVPGLGRKLIPDFLHGRSTGEDGATLGRVTQDFEHRIGLAPEDYYASVDDMTAKMKAAAKTNYDKIRGQVIDDGDALALFDEPEFQPIHERIRANARLAGSGETIPPLSTTTEIGGEKVRSLNPQTLGTLDKVKRQLDKIIQGKSDAVGPVDRDMAYSLRTRVNNILGRMDELHPDYGAARSQYRGSAEAIDAYQAGKDEFMQLDPRAINQKLAAMPDRLQDLYRRGSYDALRTRLSKMEDGANIGAFLEKNPDIRDRVAALAKSPDDAKALRGDLGVERTMGDRKTAILGGPNTAERLIDHESTKPMVTHAGDISRHIPGVGKAIGALVDNTVTRRTAEQTGDVMGEVAKLMTRTGPKGIQQLLDEIDAMQAADAQRTLARGKLGASFGASTAGDQSRKPILKSR